MANSSDVLKHQCILTFFFQGKMYPQKLIKYPFSLKIIAKTVLLMFGEEENFTYFCIDI